MRDIWALGAWITPEGCREPDSTFVFWGKELAERGGVIKEAAREVRSPILRASETPQHTVSYALRHHLTEDRVSTQAASALGFPGSIFSLPKLLSREAEQRPHRLLPEQGAHVLESQNWNERE